MGVSFLRLRRTPKLALPQKNTDIFFTDLSGVFKKMDPDGNVSSVAGAGSLPDPTDEGDVLTVASGEWAGEPPSGGSMPVKQSAVVPVSSADLLAGTAVVVVPAVNDKVLMPVALLTHYQPGAVAYDTTNMSFYLTGGGGGSVLGFANAEQAIAGLTELWTIDQPQIPPSGAVAAYFTGVSTETDLSTDLMFQAFSAPTLGDGSLDVSVLYAELAIP